MNTADIIFATTMIVAFAGMARWIRGRPFHKSWEDVKRDEINGKIAVQRQLLQGLITAARMARAAGNHKHVKSLETEQQHAAALVIIYQNKLTELAAGLDPDRNDGNW